MTIARLGLIVKVMVVGQCLISVLFFIFIVWSSKGHSQSVSTSRRKAMKVHTGDMSQDLSWHMFWNMFWNMCSIKWCYFQWPWMTQTTP